MYTLNDKSRNLIKNMVDLPNKLNKSTNIIQIKSNQSNQIKSILKKGGFQNNWNLL